MELKENQKTLLDSLISFAKSNDVRDRPLVAVVSSQEECKTLPVALSNEANRQGVVAMTTKRGTAIVGGHVIQFECPFSCNLIGRRIELQFIDDSLLSDDNDEKTKRIVRENVLTRVQWN